MSEIRDDPREVLALLNSLGFVGITASQLKAFMKDLKLHRKIRERERQQWKDETRKKILSKQEQMLKEMLHDTLTNEQEKSLESTRSTESSSNESNLIRIKVRCLNEEENDENLENGNRHNIQTNLARPEVHKNTEKPFVSAEKKQKSPRKEAHKLIRQDCKISRRPLSAPEIANRTEVPKERPKSVASDPTGLKNTRNPSRCSTHSQTKSFIRPWRLQPEAQRAASARKSDPVALYQKYRREWEQVSFPGEEKHARVRWAVREKMLGTDPNPRPILKNSQSLQSIKKR